MVTSMKFLANEPARVNKNFKKNIRKLKFGPALLGFHPKYCSIHPYFAPVGNRVTIDAFPKPHSRVSTHAFGQNTFQINREPRKQTLTDHGRIV